MSAKIIIYLFIVINLNWTHVVNGYEPTTDYPDEAFDEPDVPFTLENRILNGQEVTTNKYPFMVSLQERDPEDGVRSKFCGGVILNPRWVLTAAHCYADDDGKIIKADYFVNSGILKAFNYNYPSQFVPVERIIIHPNYDGIDFVNDIALVKVAKPFKFNEYVKPISLPPFGYRAKGIGKILGWGATDNAETIFSKTLRVANIGVSRLKDCIEKYFSDLTDKQICLGLNQTTNACAGDSGGPFLKLVKGKITVVGVTSFGKTGCNEGVPIIYTNIASYLDFIKKTMQEHEREKWIVWTD